MVWRSAAQRRKARRPWFGKTEMSFIETLCPWRGTRGKDNFGRNCNFDRVIAFSLAQLSAGRLEGLGFDKPIDELQVAPCPPARGTRGKERLGKN